MKIKSVFSDQERIPEKYTCDKDDINPPLEFLDIPQGCKSIVVIVDDPDSPSKTWVHWVAWNIKPDAGKIPEACETSFCAQGINDFGNLGYGGPCPRSGIHHYRFKAYALDSKLKIPEGSSEREVVRAMQGHVIEEAKLVGVYSLDET